MSNQTAGLLDVLISIGREIDNDLATNNRERAEALAKLAHTIMTTQGQLASAEQVPHLMRYGEQFFRWQLFAEGCEFYKGVYRLIDRLGGKNSEMGMQAVTLAGSFDYLRGGMDGNPSIIQSISEMVVSTFGESHPLTQAVKARMVAKGQTPGRQVSGAFGSPQWDMAPAAPPPPKADGSAEAAKDLALWVTLAFLRIAAADGKVDEREYLVWKNTMQAMELPDVWSEYGTEGLTKLLRQGKLQALSADFATLPQPSKVKLGTILRSLMLADGQIDKEELIAVAECVRWLGITLKDIGISVEFG
jgi:hypothetical protein